MSELVVDKKNTKTSSEKKHHIQSTNHVIIGHINSKSKHKEKERKQHKSYEDDREKNRNKEHSSHRSEYHRKKSKNGDRDKTTSEYNFKRREHQSYHTRYEKCRREKRCNTDEHHSQDKQSRRHSSKEKRGNEKDSNRKSRETTMHSSETEIHKNVYTNEHNIQNVIPSITTTLLTPETSAQSALTSEKPEMGIKLPSYYNPSVINPNKFAEQVQKRKLLWANKKDEDAGVSKWGEAKFAQDCDGKVASKFMRLMGIKSAPKSNDENHTQIETTTNDHVKQREKMFSSMEQQYEVARQVTHTMRGVGLGFTSQSKPF